MVNIKFFPLDIDYKGGIRLFGRSVDGKVICVVDNTFKPFFLVIPKQNSNVRELQKKIEILKVEDSHVILTELLKKKYFGIELIAIKVIVNNPKAITIISDIVKSFPETQSVKETDVNIVKKYLTEKQVTPLTLCKVDGKLKESSIDVDILVEGRVEQLLEGGIKPKILAFDIETHGPSTDMKEPIITIAFAGNDRYKKVITYKKFNNPSKEIEFVNDEAELILKFKEILREYKPDYLIGYFSDGFDMPYISKRAKNYGINLDIGLDRSELKISRGISQSAKIKGIVHLDIFQFIRKIMAGSLQLDSYSLNNVAKELLDMEKKSFEIRDISKIWDTGKIEDLCEYNLNDAVLTLSLCEKILPNLTELVKLVGNPLAEVSRMSYGQLVENYLIKKTREFNEIIPDKPNYSEISERRNYRYKGAFVMEPIPNLYRNIVIFDFMSLYPTIIASKNICPSTINNNRDGYKSPEIEEHGKGTYYYFNQRINGFIPSVIKDLIIRRGRVKELMKEDDDTVLEARSYALKTVANSMYGYLGFFGARWYSKECAASVTAFAREYIRDVIEKTKIAGFRVIYSDTDSVAFTLGDKNEEEAFVFLKSINDKLPDLMELELDGFYPLGIFVSKKTESHGAKKKYALIDQKGNIKIRGFETVRRDWSHIARETQRKVLDIILKENSPEKALKYVKDIIKKIQDKEIPLNKMIIQMQLIKSLESYEKVGAHVAIAKKLKERNIEVSQGMPIWYVIAEGKGAIRDKAKLPDECREGEYDTDYYINNQVVPAVEKIFEVFNYKKEDLLSKEQSTLGQF